MRTSPLAPLAHDRAGAVGDAQLARRTTSSTTSRGHAAPCAAVVADEARPAAGTGPGAATSPVSCTRQAETTLHGRSLPGVGPDPMPRTLAPMKATSGDLPEGDGWTYEVKWDGMRALVVPRPTGTLRVQSANLRDVTVSWPELAGLPDAVPAATALLDGELVATDDAGRPSFGRLQQRMHVADPAEAVRRAAEVPISYVVFDLLHLDGHDLTGLAAGDRRRLLDAAPRARAVVARLTGARRRGRAAGGRRPSRASRASWPSGATRATSPGGAPRTWRKVKVRRHQEVVVGGWMPGEGNRSGRLGALLVGYHDAAGDGGPLRFAGRVGTGFKDAELDPPRRARWRR